MNRIVKATIDQFSQFTTCLLLETNSEAQVVIAPELGARVLAISPEGLNGENLLWTNPKSRSVSGDWNFGGARTWIAPEDQFYLDSQDRWFVPAQMDPGNFKLMTQNGNTIKCTNEFFILNRRQIEYFVRISRKIQVAEAPQALPASINFAGFEFTHSLCNLGETTWGDGVDFMGLWSLVQINPGGTLLVPVNPGVRAAYRNYFNVFTPSHLRISPSGLRLKIDGKFRGKLGIAPAAASNWLGYLCDRGPAGYLILKEFTVDPHGIYLDHPWGEPAEYGDPVQMYNDDGNMGGFGEMECHAPARILAPHAHQDYTARMSFFTGPMPQLKAFAIDQLDLPDTLFEADKT